jgi:hypothetical protein
MVQEWKLPEFVVPDLKGFLVRAMNLPHRRPLLAAPPPAPASWPAARLSYRNGSFAS